MHTADFLVIGGGVIGLSIARRLKHLYQDSSVIILEKESACGLHASGRNSGVLHAGFYYSPDSLKAQLTRQGNARLREYCQEKKIAINQSGKLVVAKDETEHPAMNELVKRGKANNIALQEITAAEAKEIEPRVKTFGRALYSPTTATVDPTEVVAAMVKDAQQKGVAIHYDSGYRSSKGTVVQCGKDSFESGYIVNAAGLYADHIARDFGFSENYRILPFKGLYLYSNEPPGTIRTNIYPVPDLRNPFLGVHVTVTSQGKAKIGPTAIPAFWREQYESFGNFKFSELVDVLVRQAGLFMFSEFDFKRLAFEEIQKYSRTHLVKLATSLMEGITPERYETWGKPGIRAQLLDIKKRKLEMDFVIEGDSRSMHVLNAVSPAFTCSLPFAEYVCQKIQAQLR
ncbi:MAG: L-2-hydroxyglutarate oxidase [Nitrospirota bacterium]|nr:L-2-hydroxyglutarate oxidase [Nitrospirota bacterium]MDH5586640.1 L-2-hydroxyglutarate oxidase [Nitrospirota bacterium]MDH5774658.1 L-2-hydroxyglutarate oxidase [Nitrospirota bacterium]